MTAFELGYLGLFITCFLAATILPIASEVFLITMLAAKYDPLSSLLIASTGNTLGSYLNFGIGYIGNPEWLKKLRVKQKTIESWKASIQKYGVWLALLSWLPIVGDIIGIALGFFRANIFWSFIFMAIGKFIRYLVVILVYLYW
ncbi:MAG: DedA family protein [Crocinitomicaceae bacterium]|jgi:membrane protein YqaA with SNARE-associated domain|nr:DedA family protein [Crocinitomicaceae bacterium]